MTAIQKNPTPTLTVTYLKDARDCAFNSRALQEAGRPYEAGIYAGLAYRALHELGDVVDHELHRAIRKMVTT